MLHLTRPHKTILHIRGLTLSKYVIFGAPLVFLVLVLIGTALYTKHHATVKNNAKPTSLSTTSQQLSETSQAAPVAQSEPPSTSTPPPMNRPGNKYTDQSSAGPEKLTYRENGTLIFSPTSLTLYAQQGKPLTNDNMPLIYQHVQISTSDGLPVAFPYGGTPGNVIFGTHTDGSGPNSMPSAQSSWPLTADASNATPGTYSVNFVGWSPNHQIRYAGVMQLTVLSLP